MRFCNQNQSPYTGPGVPVFERGFGLVELLVSISIMALVSGVILAKHSAFNGAILLRNQTYEIAFALRQAQLLAVSGSNEGAVNLIQQYGINFNTTAGNNQTYTIFHDVDADGKYDAPSEQVGQVGHLDKRFIIRELRSSSGNPDQVSVLFKRPNFDALIKNANGAPLTGPLYIDIALKTANTNNDTVGNVRRVEVTSTGQISVTSYDE